MIRFSAPKNTGKRPAYPEQGPREKNFKYLKAGLLPFMAWAMEVLNARPVNAVSKAVRGEARDIKGANHSPGAAAPGAAVKAKGTKVADSADNRPKE